MVDERRIREAIENLGGRAQAEKIAQAVGTSAAVVVAVMESSYTFRLFAGGWWRIRPPQMHVPELAGQPRRPTLPPHAPPPGNPTEHNGAVKLNVVVRLNGKELTLPQFLDLTNRMLELRDYIKRWNE